MAQGKSNWTKNYRPPSRKKRKVGGRIAKKQREKKQLEMLNSVLDKLNFGPAPEIKRDLCEICHGMEQNFFTFIGDDVFHVCGKCAKNYKKVFPMFRSGKGIRILKCELGDWSKNKRSNSEYWDYRKEVRTHFITVKTDEEADYILKKFGNKYQLGILNRKGYWEYLTDGKI